MANWGGARPGSGPKKGHKWKRTLEKQAFREHYVKRMAERWDEIIDAQLDSAKGFAIIDKKDDTGERIYDVKPDPVAQKNIVDQVMGKANESLDITTGGSPLQIQVVRYTDGKEETKGIKTKNFILSKKLNGDGEEALSHNEHDSE